MKTEYLIKEVRESTHYFWKQNKLFAETNGREGLLCYTPDILEELHNRTDEDIIAEAEAKGIVLVDKEEYLAKKAKKEKTN